MSHAAVAADTDVQSYATPVPRANAPRRAGKRATRARFEPENAVLPPRIAQFASTQRGWDEDEGVILIDPPMWPRHGTLWGHLVSDTSLTELHDFARRAGIPERGFDLDHYDYPLEREAALQQLGATLVSANELTRRLIASGLRVRARDR